MLKRTDIVVVGAGPAGLTAALYTGRAKLATIVLEKMGPGGQLLNTELVEDYTGFPSITGQEMAQKFEEHALEFGAEVEYGTATEIYSEGEEKVVVTEEGDEYRCKAVIVCSGGQATKLGVPGEERVFLWPRQSMSWWLAPGQPASRRRCTPGERSCRRLCSRRWDRGVSF